MKADAQLQRDVMAELEWDPAIQATTVGVIVKDGVVTLTGQLASHAEKEAAEHAAQRVRGVKALAIDLSVKLPADAERSDADIALAAERGLMWHVLVPKDKVRVKVENGWITLDGEVEWRYQRQAAESAVRNLMGVTGVTNAIHIRPRLDPHNVEKNIHDALARQADRQANHVQVGVRGSEVTLSGVVHSWTERAAIQGAAWSAPGVTAVINDLIVET